MSTLAACASECCRSALELIGEMTSDEIDQLRGEIAREEPADWVRWCVTNRKEIRAMLATPSKHRKRDPRRDTRLRLACIQHAIHGAAVLGAMDAYKLQPGRNHREMAANAGDAYMDLYSVQMNLWPFHAPVPSEWVPVSLDCSLD